MSTRASAAARESVQGRARRSSSSAPVACAARNARSARPSAKSQWISERATGRSVPGWRAMWRSARCASCVRRGSTTIKPGPAPLRLLDEGNGVDAGHRRVHAPHEDEPRVHVVRKRGAGHLAVEAGRRAARRRGADGACQPGGAQPEEQAGVGRVLRDVAVGAAVGEREDALRPPRLGLPQPLRHERQGLVPAGAPKGTLSLSARPDAGVEQPLRAVEVLRQPAHLGADVAGGQRVRAGAADGHDAPVRHGHVEAAGVGAVQRAGGRRVTLRPARLEAQGAPSALTMRSTVSTAMGWYPGRALR